MIPKRATSPRTKVSAVPVTAYATRWVMPTVKTLLALIDFSLAGLLFVFAFYLREGDSILTSFPGEQLGWSSLFAPYGTLLPFVVVIRLVMFANFGLYKLRGEFSFV